MSDLARILDVLRAAAERGDDLAAALRSCGLPGGERAAARLAAGEPLPQAIAGTVPARIAGLLAGGIPPLATVAALLADEAWRQAERRRLVAIHLAYPIASCVVVAGIACAVARLAPPGPWYGHLAAAAWAVPPALLAIALGVAPWLPRAWRLPGSGWAGHLDLAARWARAGLAVRWRLSEAQALRLLGADLAGLATVLGSPGAEEHCRMLANWHQRAGLRRLSWTAAIAAALVLASGGGIVLGAMRAWTGHPL